MQTRELISSIESTISSPTERAYFWTHQTRYEEILDRVSAIASLRHGIYTSDNNDLKGTENQSVNATKHPDVKNSDTTHERLKPKRAGEQLKVLDVGCFPYHLGAAMEKVGLDVYGISSQHEPLRRAKIKTCNIETDKFPFKDNFFDIVIFTEVLEHLPQAPLHTLKEIYRVLTPGGHVLITTPNIARSINRAKLLLGKSVTYPLSQVLEQDGRGSNIYHRHNREYTVHEVAELAHRAGFSIDVATTFVSYTPWRRRAIPDPLWIKAGKIANYALMLLIAGLRDTVLVTGKK